MRTLKAISVSFIVLVLVIAVLVAGYYLGLMIAVALFICSVLFWSGIGVFFLSLTVIDYRDDAAKQRQAKRKNRPYP